MRSEPPKDLMRVRPCVAGGVTLCLDAARIREIATVDCLQINPGTGLPFGWLLDRSDEVGVFSLAAQLGLPQLEPIGDAAAVLIVDSSTSPFGLCVDQLLPECEVAASDILVLPPWTQNQRARFFAGALAAAEGLTLLLAPDRLHPAALPIEPEADAGSGVERSPPSTLAEHVVAGPGQLLVFVTDVTKLGPRRLLGLSARQVVEICEMPRLTPVPSAPSYVHGVALYRGRALPVVDLDAVLGLGNTPIREGQQLLVARGTQHRGMVGFPVERRQQLLETPPGFQRAPQSQNLPGGRGTFEWKGLTLVVPNVDTVASVPPREAD